MGEHDAASPAPSGWRTRATALLATTPLLGLCILSLLAIARGQADTADLARSPTRWPSSIDPLSATDFSEVASYLSDRVWQRRPLRRINALVSERLGDGTPDEVHRGRDGWLYFSRSLDQALKPGWNPQRAVRVSESVSRRIVATGREFRLLVPPNKASVYDSKLNRWAQQRQAQATERVAQLRSLLVQGEIGFVDVLPALRSESGSPEALYFRKDTHWNSLGSAVAAGLLVESLGGKWETDALQTTTSFNRTSDLTRLLGAPEKIRVTNRVVTRPDVVTTRSSEETAWTHFESRSRGAELLPPLVVLHDSFGDALQDQLPAYFESVTFVPFGSAMKPTLMELLVEAEIVVLVFVERDFVGLDDSGRESSWKSLEDVVRVWERSPSSLGAAEPER